MSDRVKPSHRGQFSWEIEEVVVNLLIETGATELAGDNILENAKTLGYRIVRKKVSKHEELVTLLKDEDVVKTVWIKQEKGHILKTEMSKEEMIQQLKERDQ